jgi:predicted acyl esterase
VERLLLTFALTTSALCAHQNPALTTIIYEASVVDTYTGIERSCHIISEKSTDGLSLQF